MGDTFRAVPPVVRIWRRLRRIVETKVLGPAFSPLRPGNIAMFHIGRSGSTVLADLLGQHPHIFWDGEVYPRLLSRLPRKGESIRKVAYPVDVVQYLRKRMRIAGRHFYGMEVKPFHLTPMGLSLKAYVAQLEQQGFRHFILLERKNYLRKIVSSLIAKERTQYHQSASEKVQLKTTYVDVERVCIDWDDKPLMELLTSYDQALDDLQGLLQDRCLLYLTYEEDIQQNPIVAYEKVCAFLGLKAYPVQVGLARTNPFPLCDIIENFGDLQRMLQHTPYAWMLEQ